MLDRSHRRCHRRHNHHPIISASILSIIVSPYLVLLLSSSFGGFRGVMAMKNIVVIGGGIQGTSVAYHLHKKVSKSTTTITILEAKEIASAASGKGGGFMARSWGDGSVTQTLHELSFDMYDQLATELNCKSYRKLPVLSVTPSSSRGGGGISKAMKDKRLKDILPNWFNGNEKISSVSCMGYGEDTAQITPSEFVTKMIESCRRKQGGKSDGGDNSNFNVVLGTCCGVETVPAAADHEEGTADDNDEGIRRKIVGVKYQPKNNDGGGKEEVQKTLPADVVIVSAGPWSCQAEDWFEEYCPELKLPMEGIKSTSIVWKDPTTTKGGDDSSSIQQVDATALFCGENNKYGTHCKFFKRKKFVDDM